MRNLLLLCLLLSATFAFGQQGAADGDFDTDGLATLDWFWPDYCTKGTAVSVQPDGKILAAGTAYDYNGRPNAMLVRYLPDGSLDPSFGTYDAYYGVTIDSIYGIYPTINAMVVAPDGSIIVAGHGYGEPVVAHFSSTGEGLLFGNLGGIAQTGFGPGSFFAAVTLQPDGKIIAAGQSKINNANNFVVVRYFSDGLLDTTFSYDGKVVTDFFGAEDGANAVVCQSDGKIIAAGHANYNFALVRYNTDGTLDHSFGTNGKVVQTIGTLSVINSMVLQPNGQILVAGYSVNGDANSTIARYNTNGTLDNTFGTNGIFTWPSGYFTSIALQPDGKIVAVGSPTGLPAFAAMRLLPTGALDPDFGLGGQALYWIFGDANATALQADGKIIVAGSVGNPAKLAVARYISSFSVGTIDPKRVVRESLIYPNPVAANATFDFELESPADLSISVLNSQGQVLQQPISSAAFSSGKQEIPLSLGQLLPGTYQLVLQAGSHVVTTQFVKN